MKAESTNKNEKTPTEPEGSVSGAGLGVTPAQVSETIEVKPLFKSEILMRIEYGTDDWINLYSIFAAVRGPDIDLESIPYVKHAFTYRVRAALAKTILDRENDIRENFTMEKAFAWFYRDMCFSFWFKECKWSLIHYFEHLESAFSTLAYLSNYKDLEEFYRTMAKICESIVHAVYLNSKKDLAEAIKRALDFNLISIDGLKVALNELKVEEAESFIEFLNEYLGIKITIGIGKGGQ
jgi:hypothetical protein